MENEKVDKFFYKVLKPIAYMGSRFETGSFLKMTEADAENIGKDYVVKEEPTEDDLAGPEESQILTGEYKEDDEDLVEEPKKKGKRKK
jgi:hypothetical protein